MKTLLPAVLSVLMFSCVEHIEPMPKGKSDVLEITSNKYTEVVITGFGSVWVNGKEPVLIKVPRGTIKFHACGNDGEFLHDGINKLVIECQ